MNGCPFCPLGKKTEWYLKDAIWRVVACEDLEERGYSYRILVVGSGPRWHRPWEQYTEKEHLFLVGLAEFMANYHIKTGKAKKLVEVDTKHFQIWEHGHCQACLK